MEFRESHSKPSSKVIEKSELDQTTLRLTRGIEYKLDPIISVLYKRAEDQCNQIISNIRSAAEYGQVTSDFTASYDNQKLADETEIEFDQIISDLFIKAENQFNQIISIIRTYTDYIQITSELTTFLDNQELIDGNKTEFEQTISDLFRRTEDQCNQILSIIGSDA